MLFSFDSFVNKVIKISGVKCNSIVMAVYSKNIILISLIFAFYTSFTFNIVTIYDGGLLYLLLYLVVFLFTLFMLMTRKVGFGMTNNSFVYVKFKHIGYKEREVYEILFDNIKYLDVKRIFGTTYVKMSFIDETGKFRKLKFSYTSIVIGFSVDEQKKNGLKLLSKLEELQKVLDRGDF